jgi:pimeloyl-ACP methyl ester carboxylesterase
LQPGERVVDVRPFRIQIPQARLEDLRGRLAAARWPSGLLGQDWDEGADLAFVQRLTEHWLGGFDWRAQEARLNRLPQFLATVDGAELHFVHQRGQGPAPLPLVITHGWPGSFAEMEHLIPLLADPGAHGGDPADAFHVVAPSLPGFGFSPAPTARGVSSARIAELWRALMQGLGYERFAAQGGDIGAGVSLWLARRFPEAVLGAHLNYIPGSYRPPGEAKDFTAEEQAFLARFAAFAAEEGAYAALQGTKPQTLAFALTDSPVGLAAWIVEKFRRWSDCGGDVERVFDLDTLLTDISLYWFSDSIAASLRLYRENRFAPLAFAAGERVTPPVGVALFPHELPMPPRAWVERVCDVRRWTAMPAGGHFAALEQPQRLAEDIRAFFRPLRQAG